MIKLMVQKHRLRSGDFTAYVSPTSVDEFETLLGIVVDEELPVVEGLIDGRGNGDNVRVFFGEREITKSVDMRSIDDLIHDNEQYMDYLDENYSGADTLDEG